MKISNLFVTYQELVNNYTQERLFQAVFPEIIQLNTFYKNPLREDKSEGCKFYFNSNNTLQFRDTSKGDIYDWLTFTMTYLGLQKREALTYIASKLNNNFTTVTKLPKQNKLIDIKIISKEFTKEEINKHFTFYNFKCNPELLRKANIFSVKTLLYNSEIKQDNCQFVYAFLNINFNCKSNYQIYFPDKDKKDRYRSNSNDIFPQLNNIGNEKYLIISKSNMDTFILKHILGFNAIGLLNETVLIKRTILEKLNEKYQIILLFDNDKAGRQAVINYKKIYKNINFKTIFVPFKYGKDIKDVVLKYDYELIKQVINNKIK